MEKLIKDPWVLGFSGKVASAICFSVKFVVSFSKSQVLGSEVAMSAVLDK